MRNTRKAASHEAAESAMLTMDQAWKRIGKNVITKQGLYLAAQRGEFPAIRLGRRILIPRRAFEEWLVGPNPSSSAA
jgi:excisionase family DNA binding protein